MQFTSNEGMSNDACYVSVNCVVPENIHTPPTDGQWKFLGGGGLKGRNFRGVEGVPVRIIFHRVVKDAIDHTRHT